MAYDPRLSQDDSWKASCVPPAEGRQVDSPKSLTLVGFAAGNSPPVARKPARPRLDGQQNICKELQMVAKICRWLLPQT
jgi:hypothetical protein